MRRWTVCVFLVALLAIACGRRNDDGDGDPIDKQSAGQVAAEVAKVSNDAYDQFSGELGSKTDGTWVTKTADGWSISGSLTNARGGSVTVEGTASQVGASGYELKLTYSFKSWEGSATGIVLEGSLSLSYTIESLSLPIKYSITYSGSLTVSGTVNGSASFALTLTRTGPLAWSYCGEISGFIVDFGDCSGS